MIIENGIYEIDGEVVMVLRYDRASNKIEVCKLTKFDPNFYGEGDPEMEINYNSSKLVSPEKFSESNLKGHKTFLLDYLLTHKAFARKYDLSKYVK
jgi:hypothetical protein|nr:MAG TPA: hypothetical protein [Caudoviricetes sp.]